tara:strand:- start:304 stop:504 length:201 start_codon:yes stop_codon:yes gene_type:complete
MVGIHYEELKIRQQEVEVKALTALVQQEAIMIYRIDAAKRLYQIAFPDKVADKINTSYFTEEKRSG